MTLMVMWLLMQLNRDSLVHIMSSPKNTRLCFSGKKVGKTNGHGAPTYKQVEWNALKKLLRASLDGNVSTRKSCNNKQ
jgi:hypothetical protein